MNDWTDALPLFGLLYAMLAIGCAYWCASIMHAKGRSENAGAAIGFFFGVLGVLIVALLSDERRPRPVYIQRDGGDGGWREQGEVAASRTASTAPDTKTCPDCAEEVKAEARICRFCRHEFAPA
ncbi:MAG: hypothetical protein DI629_03425 [Mesorhizobium amorphae]|nr:MAG: hypothetical protein DI629_03425 [Mesorhizobium amorphae]